MSEIFSWTKKTEFGSRNLQGDPAPQAVEAINFQYMEESSKTNGNQIPMLSIPEQSNGLAEAVIGSSGIHRNIKQPSEHMSEINAAAEPSTSKADACDANAFDISETDQLVNTVLDPLTLVGEQFRLLRSKLDQIQKEKGIKVLMVTSTAANEGKTFTARSLAGILAQEPGKKILLIDADLRKAKAGQNKGLLSEECCQVGLAQILGTEMSFESSLLGSDNNKLFFLPSGPVPPNPSELLSSANFAKILKDACGLFDWVILDTPPVIAISDAITICPLCDAVVLVVRANSTSSKAIIDAVQRIGREKIAGIVMNRVRNGQLARYYQQYYRGGLQAGA
jgi:protein-tyrosine kinase